MQFNIFRKYTPHLQMQMRGIAIINDGLTFQLSLISHTPNARTNPRCKLQSSSFSYFALGLI